MPLRLAVVGHRLWFGHLPLLRRVHRDAEQERAAGKVCALAAMDNAFFCNSGAEANEGAFKFARRAAADPAKHEIVALKGAFHGRTFATLAATDRPHYREPFQPLVPGIRIVDYTKPAELRRAISRERTAAVIVEPVQGEGGINVLPDALLRELRDLTRAAGAALIFDEIQCGLGRTGTLFAYEQTGVVPGMVTLAKALGGGLPMGAVLVNETIAAAIRRALARPAPPDLPRLVRERFTWDRAAAATLAAYRGVAAD